MADQADVYIKNNFADAVRVFRRLRCGSCDLELTIASGDEESIYLVGIDTSLLINAPGGVDIKDSYCRARTDLDLEVSFSRTDSNWEIKLKPNNLPPEVPTMVYITLGVDAPFP